MTTYIEYGVTLTDGQKSKLASAILNQTPLTLRLKHSHLPGSDELMLTIIIIIIIFNTYIALFL